MTTIDHLANEEIEIAARINRCAQKLEEAPDEEGERARKHLNEAIAAWREFQARRQHATCSAEELLAALRPEGTIMTKQDDVYVGDRPGAWPEDDAALFVPWPDWANAHLAGMPQPCPVNDFLSLAVEKRIPRAVVSRWLELNRLSSSWCPAELR